MVYVIPDAPTAEEPAGVSGASGGGEAGAVQ